MEHNQWHPALKHREQADPSKFSAQNAQTNVTGKPIVTLYILYVITSKAITQFVYP